MAVVQLTRELIATSAVDGKIVSYRILPSRNHTEPVKTTRYAELAVLQKALKAERPEFQGTLPPKTLRHQTSPEFVETRRGAIELYLQMCATNDAVQNSQAWRAFFSGTIMPANMNDSTASNAQPPPTDSAASGAAPAAASPKMSAVDEHESEGEDEELEGSVYDKLRSHLAKKKEALASVQTQHNDLSSRLSKGELELQIEDEERDVAFAHRREAVTRLSTHRFSLQELEHELTTLKRTKGDLEASKLTEIKSLEEGLAQAREATQTGQQKFEAARSARTQAEAEGKNKIVEVDNKVLTALVDRAAATEHLTSMRAALSVMADRLKERETEARKIKIESDVAQKAREQVQAEVDTVQADVRRQTNTAMNTAAALKSHTETSARRARAFEAEVRRAKECNQHAANLRDLRSRGELLGEDRKGLENAELMGSKGAESAGKTLAMTLNKAEESLQADKLKRQDLRNADENATARLKQHEIALKHMQTRLVEVESKYKEASEKFALANAARKVAKDDFNTLESRVKGELQAAADDTEKKLKDTQNAAKEARAQVDRELAPLLHKEEAEHVVLTHAQEAETTLVQNLDEARTLAAEAKDDQYEAKPDDHEKVKQGDRRSLLIESAKSRVVDHQREVEKATAEAKSAEAAVRQAEPGLKEQENQLEAQRAEIRREAEAVLAEEDASRGSSFADELQNMISNEDDFPEIQQIQGKIAVMKANLDDLNLKCEEKKSALQAASAAAESANAELAQLNEEEKNAELPPLTAYYLAQELQTTAEHMKRHEDAQDQLLEAGKKRREDWAKEKARLQEGLHQAGISIEVAKDDLAATKAIAPSIRKSMEQ